MQKQEKYEESDSNEIFIDPVPSDTFSIGEWQHMGDHYPKNAGDRVFDLSLLYQQSSRGTDFSRPFNAKSVRAKPALVPIWL